MSLRLINIARSALFAQRGALEIIGHNTANVETPGYVRQHPVLASIPGAITGEAGGGVELTDIRLLRDEMLATQIRGETGTLGRERALRSTLLQVEQVFTDVSAGGLALRIEEMFDAWADLGLSATSSTCRENVVERARLAADSISERWHALDNLRVEIDARLGASVDRANSLAAEVARINQTIGGAGPGSARNDLITRREALIGELAGLCGAEAIEQEDGIVDLLIGGRRFVEHAQVNELRLVPDPAQPGMHLVALGQTVSPEGLRGEIAGRIEARDEFIPGYMQHLDTLAATLTDEVNALHSGGQDLAGNAGGNFFTCDATRPAATLNVLSTIIADPDLIAAAQSDVVESDGTNALAINELRNRRLFFGGTETLSGAACELISTLGIDAEAAQTRLDSRELLLEGLQSAYTDQAGVSLDEEALDLIRYQQAYTAASRLMQTALDMMQAVIELT